MGDKNMIALKVRKWTELNWLRCGHKEIPLPDIIFEQIELAGCYCRPVANEIIIGNRFYDLSKGIILVNPNDNDDCIKSVIAHEWRHHCQWYAGLSAIKPRKFKDTGNYRHDIIDFFNNNDTEIDALIFSIAMAPCETNMLWAEWLGII